MLASITPLGERGRSNRWSTTVVAHVVGGAAAAGAQGMVLGAAGSVVAAGQEVRAVLMAAAVAAAVALDVLGVPRPGLRRQVAEEWIDRYRGWVYGAGFGLQLGLGWATIVTTWLVWAALAGMLLAGGPVLGALVGVAFGLGRVLPVLATVGVADGASLQDLHRRFAVWEPRFARVALAGSSAAGLVLAVLSLGRP